MTILRIHFIGTTLTLNNNQGSKNMNIDKFIIDKKTPLASETELLSYKLLLNCQITDAQETLVLIEKQLKKIELKKPEHDFKFPFAGRL